MDDFKQIKLMPTVTLRGMTILPDMVIHFDVSRKRSIKAVEKAMLEDQRIFLVTQIDVDDNEPDMEGLYKIGCIASVKQVIKLPNNILRVLVEGEGRGQLEAIIEEEEYILSEVSILKEDTALRLSQLEQEAMVRNLKELFTTYCNENFKVGKEMLRQILEYDDLQKLVDQIIINLSLHFEQKQKMLSAVNLEERYELLTILLSNETEIFKIKKDLQTKIKEKVDKNQREYLLREQQKLIREELGEDNIESEAEQFLEQLKKRKVSKEVKEKIEKEIKRFKSISYNSSESAVIRGYIETLLEMPWNKASKDNTDLRFAKKVLNVEHYGLEKVKERILEFLAVRTLTQMGQSPIICLVGPPGTGKTSIARSVARALGKEYVRISLGGVRDEAEIRGHRRTYVGAMPGRIANGLKQAGVKNPLMLLDEIDKVSSDYKGDTSAALLEVLDSEQNNKFRDHYIELPIDLSDVLFIATANSLQTIPKPLLDRMEIIEVSSYTENEKLHIAKGHLMNKQLLKHGLSQNQLSISDKALASIIRYYTKEAGVRNLERKLGEICRKTARQILENNAKSIKITQTNLEKFLGKKKYRYDMANEKDEIGIVRGLAWTSVGGDTLQIEVNVMPGKGEILLTGQLGDVMKESAKAGISYIRSMSKTYQIEDTFFKENDIHIHIPEGAVPKDGPSAGITMATAMISAITKIPVKASVAMTGEITLRGRVLPIGGLKEKTIAAKNANIKTILVPGKNKKDMDEVPDEIKKDLKIVFVDQMEEVLKEALVQKEDV
ncbi:endopeptidase La [Candidatus Galacturonibacter soehngenii]|uniref:Lon protease n=1 Tax=Candidatus Galacturonatibacter soehngenii TaxID=2307010 RepID=A0A7V7UDQ3_9FIRM|nr:endopeptidase La [Candidatus Galacturonibacter soehngenii]KAB1440982.1 endopeptidase La [Candidatus Galacturonibacter soehngenii]